MGIDDTCANDSIQMLLIDLEIIQPLQVDQKLVLNMAVRLRAVEPVL